ncbi:cytochrome c [Burkholderiaceae bacterium DAT-1]|nr:cytochrome c [Burkholderiaceae bacterium DAT-1]
MNIRISLLIASAIAAVSTLAQADALADRKEAFKAIKEPFKVARGVAEGKVAYDKAAFEKTAAELVEAGKKPWALFPAGSGGGKSEARPEVWSKPAEFKAAADKFQDATLKLADSAKAGELDKIKLAIAAVGETCKACHKDFKKD